MPSSVLILFFTVMCTGRLWAGLMKLVHLMCQSSSIAHFKITIFIERYILAELGARRVSQVHLMCQSSSNAMFCAYTLILVPCAQAVFVPGVWVWCTLCASRLALLNFTITLFIFLQYTLGGLGAGRVSLVHLMWQLSSITNVHNYTV